MSMLIRFPKGCPMQDLVINFIQILVNTVEIHPSTEHIFASLSVTLFLFLNS